jgi:hypothetical protein
MSNRPKQRTWTDAAAFAIATALTVVGGCSSGAHGPLVGCVVPGSACCPGKACANGLTCKSGVCAAVDSGGVEDAAASSEGGADGSSSTD